MFPERRADTLLALTPLRRSCVWILKALWNLDCHKGDFRGHRSSVDEQPHRYVVAKSRAIVFWDMLTILQFMASTWETFAHPIDCTSSSLEPPFPILRLAHRCKSQRRIPCTLGSPHPDHSSHTHPPQHWPRHRSLVRAGQLQWFQLCGHLAYTCWRSYERIRCITEGGLLAARLSKWDIRSASFKVRWKKMFVAQATIFHRPELLWNQEASLWTTIRPPLAQLLRGWI